MRSRSMSIQTEALIHLDVSFIFLQGLSWLRQREIWRNFKCKERERLHPLWAEYRLPDGTALYVKDIGTRVSLQRPNDSSRGLGGILSDEMGLGKTVQLLALCSLDKPYTANIQQSGTQAKSKGWTSSDACLEPALIDTCDLRTEGASSDVDGMLAADELEGMTHQVDKPDAPSIDSVSLEPSKSDASVEEDEGLIRGTEILSDVVDLTSEESVPPPGAGCPTAARQVCDKFSAPAGVTGGSTTQPAASNKKACSLHALLCSREEPKLVNGGTLVICPMSILAQWEDELSLHLQPGHLRVAVHYGGDRTLSPRVLSRPDVVLTTYGVLSAEFVRTSQGGPVGARSALYAIEWHRIILDEAHYIKGRHTQVAQAVFALKGERRWAVTGTPVQNKLDDLYPLLRFIHFEPWCQVTFWQRHVIRPFEENKDLGALKVLRQALQPLLLRRTKDSKDRDGRPILSLPPRVDEVVELEFAEEEREFYDALFRYSRARFDAFLAAGKVMNNYASILEMLLRLRQCCAHPYLMLSRCDIRMFDHPDLARLASRLSGVEATDPRATGPQADHGSNQLTAVDAAVAQGKGGVRDAGSAQECPICLESVEDAVVTPCAHVFCRECINDAIRKSSGTLCPSCRAPVSRSELVSLLPPVVRSDFDAQVNWRSSKKLDYLVEQLTGLREQEGDGAKSVVFSQWTGMLDLVEIALRRAGLEYTRLDGSMSQQRRVDNVQAFAASPKISVLLISLKAGGVGINLTAANHVFLLDMWWNPAVDEQVPLPRPPPFLTRFLSLPLPKSSLHLLSSL